MMTDEQNFIMLMETPNSIETEKKYSSTEHFVVQYTMEWKQWSQMAAPGYRPPLATLFLGEVGGRNAIR